MPGVTPDDTALGDRTRFEQAMKIAKLYYFCGLDFPVCTVRSLPGKYTKLLYTKNGRSDNPNFNILQKYSLLLLRFMRSIE